MSATVQRPSPVSRLLGGLLILTAILLLIGLFITNYTAALALLIGIGIAMLLTTIVRWMRERIASRRLILGLAAGLGLLLCAVIGLAILLSGEIGATGANPEPSEEDPDAAAPQAKPLIRAYRIYVSPAEERGVFNVQEEVVYDMVVEGQVMSSDQVMLLPTRQVTAESKGFLLSEVVIYPSNPVYVRTETGGESATRLCLASCPPTTVELRDFPENAFYAARESAEVERAPYVGTETVSWSTRRLDRGLAFTYIPSPFQALRGLIGPLLGASSISEWAAGLLGMISAMFAIPLLKPLVVDIAEDKASERIKRFWEQRKQAKVKKTPPQSPAE